MVSWGIVANPGVTWFSFLQIEYRKLSAGAA